MNNRQIDAAVAEAMGLVTSRENESPTPANQIARAKPGDYVIVKCKDYLHYSTDIAAALEIVEWMQSRLYVCDISIRPRLRASATFHKLGGIRHYRAEGQISEAICFAFLKARGVEVDASHSLEREEE